MCSSSSVWLNVHLLTVAAVVLGGLTVPLSASPVRGSPGFTKQPRGAGLFSSGRRGEASVSEQTLPQIPQPLHKVMSLHRASCPL